MLRISFSSSQSETNFQFLGQLAEDFSSVPTPPVSQFAVVAGAEEDARLQICAEMVRLTSAPQGGVHGRIVRPAELSGRAAHVRRGQPETLVGCKRVDFVKEFKVFLFNIAHDF